MEIMNSADVVVMLGSIAKAMNKQRLYLIELDSVVGDGDLGITMEKGFQAAYSFAKDNQNLKPGEILMRAGMQIAKVAPSTMGTLIGTGMIRGGKVIANKESLSASDLTLFFDGFLNGVLERGKANRGEKTIVDILYPLVESMKAYHGTDIYSVLAAGVSGALKGLEDEKGMISQHGRAAIFREKTLDIVDPGSMAIVILIQACRDSIA